MNSASRKLLLVAALALVAGAVFLWINLGGGAFFSEQRRGQTPESTPQSGPSDKADNTGSTGTDPGSSVSGTDAKGDRPLRFPTVEQVREEVKQAPHEGLPPSVRAFVDVLALRMEEALGGTDPTPARELFKELESCAAQAGDGKPAANVQVQCAWSARRLSEERQDAPELPEKWKALEGRLPAPVALLLSQMDRLQEKADRGP